METVQPNYQDQFLKMLKKVKELNIEVLELYPCLAPGRLLPTPTDPCYYIMDQLEKIRLHQLLIEHFERMKLMEALCDYKKLQPGTRLPGNIIIEKLDFDLLETIVPDDVWYCKFFWCTIKTNKEFITSPVVDFCENQRPSSIKFNKEIVLSDIHEGIWVEVELFYRKIPGESIGVEPSPLILEYPVHTGGETEILRLPEYRKEKIGSVVFQVVDPALGLIWIPEQKFDLMEPTEYLAVIEPTHIWLKYLKR